MAPTYSLDPGLAFIFDVDGVLVNSNPVHVRVWRLYLEPYGIDFDLEMQQRMYGKHNQVLVREMFGEDLSAEQIADHGSAKEALYRKVIAPELERHVVAGLKTFLQAYPGVPKAVASNAEPANVDFILDSAQLRQHFEVSLNGHDVERPKPFPDIYLEAARRLRVAPRNCIVFEDSESGVEAGLAAGMRVVGIETTHPLSRVEVAVPDFSSPRLHAWLAEQRAESGALQR